MRRCNDWSVLCEEEARILAAARHRRRYAAGETIYPMGEPGYGVYCVCSGIVALRRVDTEGSSVLLQIVYPGDTLGYESLLTGTRHRSGAEALRSSNICHINGTTVRELLERNPNLGLQFLKHTSAKLADAQERLVQNATLPNRMKFAHLLLVLMDRHGTRNDDGSARLHLPLPREDLASMIAIRRETLSRIMGRLERDGVASFSGRTVAIPNVATLMRELEPHLI